MQDTPKSDAPSTAIDVERLKTDFPYFCEVIGIGGPWEMSEPQKAVFEAVTAPGFDPRRALLGLKPRRQKNLS